MGRRTQPDTTNTGHNVLWASCSHSCHSEQTANCPDTANSPEATNTGHDEHETPSLNSDKEVPSRGHHLSP
eukprot:1146432-Alexandrium_andersonii.AAC.1